jgi:hypothetical protein
MSSWQDSTNFKESELVKKWSDMLFTVGEAVEHLQVQKQGLLKKKEEIIKAKETKNG